MQAPLACDPSLRQVMTEDFWGSMGGGNQTIQNQFCDASCGNDLATYRSTVKQACAGDPEPLPGFPATYWGDSASAAWNQICLKDSQTGAYCVGMLAHLSYSTISLTKPLSRRSYYLFQRLYYRQRWNRLACRPAVLELCRVAVPRHAKYTLLQLRRYFGCGLGIHPDNLRALISS